MRQRSRLARGAMDRETFTQIMSRKQNYRCPQCDIKIVLYVKPSSPPICNNPKKHSTKPVEMIPTSKTN
jgi:DNA-directed RNA polymerase subunit RPC12/RpoP